MNTLELGLHRLAAPSRRRRAGHLLAPGRRHPRRWPRGGAVTVRASVGLTQVLPEDQTPTVENLLAHADIAMYTAKRGGKGQLACYDATMTSANADDLTLRRPLIDAITAHRMKVDYQPIVDIDTIVGLEALARWTHDGTAIPPHRFIPIAHRAGMIGELTDHMLEHATALDAPGVRPERT